MMDSLEIISLCGQEFSLYSKLNDKMEDLEYQGQGLLSHLKQVLYVLY